MKVACALIISDKKVLVAQRPINKNQGGKWEFPGGKLMENETPGDCIVREIAEELDLEIKVLDELEPVIHTYPTFTIELIPLLCAIHEGSITLHEHTDFKWADIKTLSEMDLCDADRKILPLLEAFIE